MKKILFILSSAALVFTACQKEENVANSGEGMFLTATVEQQVEGADTKSSLSETTVNWTSGDLIKVFDASGKYDQLSAQTSGTSVSFKETGTKETGFSESGNHYAIYPYSDATCSGSTITFTLPATQTYAAGSFGQDANVAVASFSGSSKATFKNVCGVFKLTIYGNYTVSKIELSGKNSEKLNGSFTVDASSDAPACSTATTTTDSEKTITLDCSKEKDGGVTLSPPTATTFYFVVPVGAFAKPEGDEAVGGFVAKVYEKDNTTSYTYTELSTTSANTIVRSKVKAMPANTIVPPAYQKVEYLESTGTQYIDSEIKANSAYTYNFKVARSGAPFNTIVWGMKEDTNYTKNKCLDLTWTTDGYHIGAYSHSGGGSGGIPSVIMWGEDVKHTIKFNPTGSVLVIDGTDYWSAFGGGTSSVTTLTNASWTSTYNLYLSGGNVAGTIIYSNGTVKWYEYSVYDGTTLKQTFIPTKCKSGASYTDGNTGNSSGILAADKPGMYDLKTGKFFVNQNSSSASDFTTGPAVTY